MTRSTITALKLPSEHDEQKALISWFAYQYPHMANRLVAVPNGGQRHVRVATKLKAEGVRPGFPDLMLLIPRQGFAGLMIELKRRQGGTLGPNQADWLAFLNEQGFLAVMCKGADGARETITEYLGGALHRNRSAAQGVGASG